MCLMFLAAILFFCIQIFAHEMGHNLKMRHDFEPHDPLQRECVGPLIDGYMDYGIHR